MKRLLSLAGSVWLLATSAGAQTAKRLHVAGSSARQLLSLLVNGSPEIRAAVGDRHQTEIIVHDLLVISRPTGKYDTDDPCFELGVYQAKGRLDTAASSTAIGEATALFKLFTELGLPIRGAMDGMSFQLDTVDCKITVAETVSARRFACVIEYSG